MLYEHLHNIAVYLADHPDLGGFITYIIALTESLAIIGTIVPGSVTMTAIGALIGSGVLPAFSTILWAVLGAFSGDFISYWFGAYYNERLRNIWPFRKYPHLLTLGEVFFKKHGGKSIIIGRFAGPVRSLVPLIAGLLHMSIPRFIIAALPSAILWALVYMIPGILIGALSLELPPAMATKFIIIILLIIALSWLVFWLIHLFLKTSMQFIHKLTNKLWRYLETHKTLHWITTMLNDPRYPDHHQQLLLAIFTLIAAILFGITFGSIVTHNFITTFNEPLFELLRSLRNRVTDDVMIPMTLLGDKHTLLIASALIFIWLGWRKHWRAAMHWLVVVFGGAALIEIIKRLHYSPRPSGLLNADLSSSFPSGHTTLSIIVFGFLTILIARELQQKLRWIPYAIAIFFVILIALSRIYLGAHWLTDVIGSFFLGLTCIFAITVSYRRNPTRHISPRGLSIVSVIILLVVWLAYGIPQFRPAEDAYTPYWSTLTLDMETWWQQNTHQIPLYVLSRLGNPKQALNVEWLGTLDNIKQILVAQGWQEHTPHLNLKTTINQLGQGKHNLPILPTLYQNQAPALLLTKTDNKGRQLVFELWKSNITLQHISNNDQLWLGSIYYFLPKHEIRELAKQKNVKNIFLGATDELTPYLANYHWHIFTVLPAEQPSIMQDMHWDGNLLLIRNQNIKDEIPERRHREYFLFDSQHIKK